MKISILCTDQDHPVISCLQRWAGGMAIEGHLVSIAHDKTSLTGGDILFLVSCSQVIGSDVQNMYRRTLVLHASDLPKGRGWSPYVWEVINGESKLTVSLLEASEGLVGVTSPG